MDIEFHYYMTNIIARRAGFTKDEAYKIAYASQYVDDNCYCFTVNSGQKDHYENFISQTMNILKPKHELLRIYPIFHFMPGEPSAMTAYRRDGKQHLLNTTPGNENANALLDHAFKSSEDLRLYQIGVATHTFVDTWAHQNFVGWYDEFNFLDGDIIIPDIGHAEAMHNPDLPAHLWKDKRLTYGLSHVNNINRFMDAGKSLFNKYTSYLNNQANPEISWDSVESELVTAIGTIKPKGEGKKERIKRYQEVEKVETYDDQDWFKKAIKTDVRGLPDSKDGLAKEYLTFFRDRYSWKTSNYKNTDWYKFQEAVKAHERKGLKLLAPTFKKMGIDLKSS